MKAELKFDLSQPGQKEALDRAMQGPSLANVIWEAMIWLRNQEKYNGRSQVPVSEALERMHQLLREEGLSFDDLLINPNLTKHEKDVDCAVPGRPCGCAAGPGD